MQALAVSCGATVKLWKLDAGGEGHNRWSVAAELEGHTSWVHDVAWAPNLGRRCEWLATACKDGKVRIYQWLGETHVKPYCTLSEHEAEVWKVEWNVTGTVLSSTGDDGCVRLWKQTFLDEWKLLTTVSAES